MPQPRVCSDGHARRFELLAELSALLAPPQPPPGWEFLPSRSNARQIPACPEAILASLENKFSRDELHAVRIARRDSAGSVRLSPVLGVAGAPALVLRAAPEAPPFDFVGVDGSLVASDPPSFHASRDVATRVASGETRLILAAGDPSDLMILSLLGMPVTSFHGLASLSGLQARRLFGISLPHESPLPAERLASVTQQGYSIVLVGWTIHRMDPTLPAALATVVRHLQQVNVAFDSDVLNSQTVRIWRPIPQQIEKLAAARSLSDSTLLFDRMWRSVLTNTHALSHVVRQLSQAPLNYHAARRQLEARRGDEGHVPREQIQQEIAGLSNAFEQEMVEPLVRGAMSAEDDLERALMLQAAGVLRRWHATDETVVHFQQTVVGGMPSPEEDAQRAAEHLAACDQLIRLQRALQSRQPRRRRRRS
jgi:hypothetical protein